MKQFIVFFLLLTLLFNSVSSQSAKLPVGTEIQPFLLSVGYNKTTVLLFPAPIKDADRGRQDVIISRQAGMNNVLKVKAGRKEFEPSNLHVFTADGKLYSFEVQYGDGSGGAYDLSCLPFSGKTVPSFPLIFPEVEDAAPDTQMRLRKIGTSRPFFRMTVRKHQLRLQLLAIHFDHDRLYFRYRIRNRSALPYQINFSRMFISDGGQVRRSTSQQQEIIPDLTSGEKLVPGHASVDFIFVLKRFTIPEAKKFQLEFFEKNGGRNIRFEVKTVTFSEHGRYYKIPGYEFRTDGTNKQGGRSAFTLCYSGSAGNRS